jgi:hypothetical protein
MALFPQALARTRWTVDTVAGILLFFSTLYLALPHLIFFFGWLQWLWALLAAGSVCAALATTLRWSMRHVAQQESTADSLSTPDISLSELQVPSMPPVAARVENDGEATFVFTRQHALMIGAICLMWLTLSGVAGFVRQDQDWDKHNMVLNSLILKPWPAIYEIYQVNIPLVYYIGYYLPAALVGKVGGWFWANQALFLWSLTGLIVSALWFCILVRRVSTSVLLIFVFFSGIDVIGRQLSIYGGLLNAGKGTWQHMDPWALLWQYSSHSTLLFWVPNQALAGWSVTGMLLYCVVRVRRRELILLPVGLSAFWSPFVTIGLIPYLVLDFLVDIEPVGTRIRRMVTLPNLVGLLVLVITGFYFSAKASEGSPIVIQSLFNGFSLTQYDGSIAEAIIFLIFFCLIEFGIYAILLYRSGAIQDERWRWMLDISVLTLFILPWFKFGVYNDLVMRASIPALFVLAVIVARAAHDNSLTRQTRVALVVVLLLGSVTSGVEIMRHFRWMTTQDAPLFDVTQAPKDFVGYFQGDAFFFGQYAGSIESPFFQVAAKALPESVEALPGSAEFELNDHDYTLYGNQVYLLRDTMTLPAEVMAGSTITVPWQLHFFGPAIGQPLEPTLRLVDEGGRSAWETKGWPTGGPTVAPFAMTHWTGEMTVSVPISATPGLYDLEVGFTWGDGEKYLVAHSVPDGEAIGEIVAVGSMEVVPGE